MGASFLGRYRHLIINLSSASGLLVLGDLVVQIAYQKNKKKTIDENRLIAAFGTGAILGVEAHIWYTFLDRIITQPTWYNVFKKVILDQIVGGTLYTTTYILGTSLLEGQTSFDELKYDIKSNFGALYLVNCLIYNPAQIINFKYLSTSCRVPFVFLISFLYNSFSSAYKHSDKEKHVYDN